MIRRFSAPKAEAKADRRSFDDFDLRLGDIMRGERATLGKSLLDVQRELKIKAAYIAAIENADPTAFETQGFVAGYVRSYARYLGMDPEWAYAKFCEEGNFAVPHGMSAAASPALVKPVVPEGPRDIFANPNTPFVPRGSKVISRIEPGALGSVAVLVLLIAGLGYGGWSILNEIQKVRFAPVEQAPGVTAEISDIATPGAATSAGQGTQIAAPSPDALDRLYRPAALDVPVLVARDGPISTLDPRKVGTLTPGAPARMAAVPGAGSDVDQAVAEALGLGGTQAGGQPGAGDAAAQAPGPDSPRVLAGAAPEVVMFAVRPSWVRVKAADGTVLLEKVLDAGETYALPQTQDPPILRAGNAGSVYFTIGGKTYGPSGAGPSIVDKVALSPAALTEKYAVADLDSDRDLADFVAVAQNTAVPALPLPTE